MATKTTTTVTPKAWAQTFLSVLNESLKLQGKPGVKATANNVNNVQLWLHNEQSASSWNADLNNPLGVGGGGLSTAPNLGGVSGGIVATANNLLTGNYGYNNIVSALQQNAPTTVFAAAVVNSKWNGAHYGGVSSFLSKGPLGVSGSSTANPTGLIGQTLNLIPGYSAVDSAGHSVVNAAGATLGVATAATKLLGNLTSATFWKRIGIFAGGAVLAGGGVLLFVASSKTTHEAVKDATAIA